MLGIMAFLVSTVLLDDLKNGNADVVVNANIYRVPSIKTLWRGMLGKAGLCLFSKAGTFIFWRLSSHLAI